MNKCENAIHQWPENGVAKSTLQKLGLVQQNGTIDGEVKKVLLCSVECSRSISDVLRVKIVNPINGTVVADIKYPPVQQVS
jgi:hypothetical protein